MASGLNTLHTTACAKFIISGEHSIISEGIGLAVPLMEKKLRYSEGSETENSKNIILLNGKILSDPAKEAKVNQLRAKYCEVFGLDPNPQPAIKIDTNIPIGKGLGSSAALCVAMARYFAHKKNCSLEQIAEIALKGEELFHATPSGIDPYCVALEKPICFSRNDKFIENVNFDSFAKSDFIFALIDTGLEHNTEKVIANIKHKPEIIRNLASLSSQMKEALANSAQDIPTIMESIQRLLGEYGASNSAVESTIDKVKKMGALSAKISGSGRGGYILALFANSDVAKWPSNVREPFVFWQPLAH